MNHKYNNFQILTLLYKNNNVKMNKIKLINKKLMEYIKQIILSILTLKLLTAIPVVIIVNKVKLIQT